MAKGYIVVCSVACAWMLYGMRLWEDGPWFKRQIKRVTRAVRFTVTYLKEIAIGVEYPSRSNVVPFDQDRRHKYTEELP